MRPILGSRVVWIHDRQTFQSRNGDKMFVGTDEVVQPVRLGQLATRWNRGSSEASKPLVTLVCKVLD